MAEREVFLARWSRLKAASQAPPAVAAEPDAVPPPAEVPEPAPEIDLAALPPVDSLGADSDYTQFLRTGVPAALRTAALRRAWVSDPQISGFRGFGEYDWDCNAPGYGRLLPTDDIRSLCDRVLGAPEAEPPEPPEELPPEPETADLIAAAPAAPPDPPPGEDAG